MKFSICLLCSLWLFNIVLFLPYIKAQALEAPTQEEIQKEVRKHVMVPCRNIAFKKYALLLDNPNVVIELIKGLREFEALIVKSMLKMKKTIFDKDLRMTFYLVARHNCEKAIDSN